MDEPQSTQDEPNNTELIYFGSQTQLQQCVKSAIKVINDEIPKSDMIRYLDEETCETPVQSLVISYLDYANVLRVGVTQGVTLKLQWVQNIAAKLVLNKN